MKHGCAREHGGAGGGVCGGIAARSFRKEASSVDRIDRDIGTIRCVGCCPQLGSILFAGLRDSACKFDHGFSSGNCGKNIDEALHGEELLIGVECVELGFVRCVRRAGVLLHVVLAILRRGVGKIGELRGDIRRETRHCLLELRAIIREIGPHGEASGIHDDGYQVGACHLLLDEL